MPMLRGASAQTLRSLVVTLLTAAALSCSDTPGRWDPEGPCFAPGEACASVGFCSQAGFCLQDAGPPTCVPRRVNGSACVRDEECIGTCEAGLCAGSPRPCHA